MPTTTAAAPDFDVGIHLDGSMTLVIDGVVTILLPERAEQLGRMCARFYRDG